MDSIGAPRISSDKQALALNRQTGTGMEWHWLDGSCRNGATVICNTQGGF